MFMFRVLSDHFMPCGTEDTASAGSLAAGVYERRHGLELERRHRLAIASRSEYAAQNSAPTIKGLLSLQRRDQAGTRDRCVDERTRK